MENTAHLSPASECAAAPGWLYTQKGTLASAAASSSTWPSAGLQSWPHRRCGDETDPQFTAAIQIVTGTPVELAFILS